MSYNKTELSGGSVGKKCAEISMVMADAYNFLKLRAEVEQIQEQVDRGI